MKAAPCAALPSMPKMGRGGGSCACHRRRRAAHPLRQGLFLQYMPGTKGCRRSKQSLCGVVKARIMGRHSFQSLTNACCSRANPPAAPPPPASRQRPPSPPPKPAFLAGDAGMHVAHPVIYALRTAAPVSAVPAGNASEDSTPRSSTCLQPAAASSSSSAAAASAAHQQRISSASAAAAAAVAGIPAPR